MLLLITDYSVNLLFSRNLSPYANRYQKPAMPSTLRPPSRLQPSATPSFRYNGRANKTAAAAKILRSASLAANRLAAYRGYVSGMYMKMPRPTTKPHPQYKTMPAVGTTQWTEDRAAQPKRNMPAVTPNAPAKPGRRKVSWVSNVPSLLKRLSVHTRYQMQYHVAPRTQATRTQTNTALVSPRFMP